MKFSILRALMLTSFRSISQQVERLEQDPTMRDVVNILRNILRKMKAREMELQMQ